MADYTGLVRHLILIATRYVLAIKDNNRTLHKAVSGHFDQVHEEGCIETWVRHHHSRREGMLRDSILS
jgi:hypothetical protein